MSKDKNRTWEGWATVAELSLKWKITRRRVQQILAELSEDVFIGMIVTSNENRVISCPIYKMVGKWLVRLEQKEIII